MHYCILIREIIFRILANTYAIGCRNAANLAVAASFFGFFRGAISFVELKCFLVAIFCVIDILIEHDECDIRFHRLDLLGNRFQIARTYVLHEFVRVTGLKITNLKCGLFNFNTRNRHLASRITALIPLRESFLQLPAWESSLPDARRNCRPPEFAANRWHFLVSKHAVPIVQEFFSNLYPNTLEAILSRVATSHSHTLRIGQALLPFRTW